MAAASTKVEKSLAKLFDMAVPIFKHRVVFRDNVAPLGEGNGLWGMGALAPLDRLDLATTVFQQIDC